MVTPVTLLLLGCQFEVSPHSSKPKLGALGIEPAAGLARVVSGVNLAPLGSLPQADQQNPAQEQ